MTHPEQRDFLEEVDTFLDQEGLNDDTEAFAEEATKAKSEDSRNEVDFKKKIIKTKPFLNEPCLAGILDELDYSSIAQGYLDNFTGENPVSQLKFDARPFVEHPTRNAQTSSPVNGVINITFNTDNLDRPRAEIARTFVHEIIHAELYRRLLELSNNGRLSGITTQNVTDARDSHPLIYEYWTQYAYDRSTPTIPQHELIAQHLRGSIEGALLEFDPTLSSQMVRALAWDGLKRSFNGDKESRINQISGLVVDPITGENESTVAWTNTPLSERLQINQDVKTFRQNQPKCK